MTAILLTAMITILAQSIPAIPTAPLAILASTLLSAVTLFAPTRAVRFLSGSFFLISLMLLVVNDQPVCVGEAKCTNPDRCVVASCDQSTGTCSFADKTCNGGDACQTISCVDGNCKSTPVVCDDGDPCTLDLCDPVSGTLILFFWDFLAHSVGCTFPQGGCDCVPDRSSDLCYEYVCEGGITVPKSKCVAREEGCWVFTGNCLDPQIEGCEKRLKCAAPDTCAISTWYLFFQLRLSHLSENDVCQSTPVNCDDGNPCTVDTCIGIPFSFLFTLCLIL